MLIQVNEITKNYSGAPIFQGLSLTVEPGAKIGLVGMNGSGKSTLLRIMAGEIGVDQGVVARQKGLRIGYVPQKLVNSEESVKDYLLASFTEVGKLRQELQRTEQLLADPDADFERLLAYYGRLQEKYEQAEGYSLEDRIFGTLKGLGLADKWESPLSQLSGGQRVRVELARVLTDQADVLLLDEPTNHLDLAGINWLESYLQHSQQAYLVISHDREFLDHTVTQIVELEGEAALAYPGNNSRFAELKQPALFACRKIMNCNKKKCGVCRR